MTRTSTNQAMNRLLSFAQWHPCKYPCIRPGLVLGAHNVGQHFAYSPNSIHNPPTALSAALFPSQNPTAVYMRFGHGATMLRSDTSIISRQFSPMNGPVASHEHSYHDAIIPIEPTCGASWMAASPLLPSQSPCHRHLHLLRHPHLLRLRPRLHRLHQKAQAPHSGARHWGTGLPQ